jgi:hypothetical protein
MTLWLNGQRQDARRRLSLTGQYVALDEIQTGIDALRGHRESLGPKIDYYQGLLTEQPGTDST